MESKEPRGSTFTKDQFLALTWALYSIAAVFFSARIFIRLKLNKHLELDDGLVAFSMIMFTALSILQTAYVDTTFEVQFVRTDHRPAPAGFEEASSRFAQYQWAIAYFFFTGIWAVKGSFLAFYEKLTQRLPRIRRAWWIGIVFTFLTYIGSLLAYAFLNGLKFKKSLRNKAINYQFAADFTTDIIITAIPLTLALQSSIPFRQKLLLSLIFGMTFVITIFSLTRYVVNRPSRPPAGPSWLQVWSSIEHSVSISIASAASFRAFVVQRSTSAERKSSLRHQTSSYLHLRKARKGSGFSQLTAPNEDSAISSEGREVDGFELEERDRVERLERGDQAPERREGSKKFALFAWG